MTAARRQDVHRAAARAALDVPGVAALQPGLADRLAHAAAASRAHHVSGIRCNRTPEGGWHVEVRCILHADTRVVDVARHVREHVRTAVTACLGTHGAIRPVDVLVTVTRTV
ncbi:Asp23/Gls24 family envelope stress response protein [Streptomyces sp. NPDC007369]|uniref:Asp23/Gls24 family envelope stress response protein n=1 Tax=Streptomyces sp. NPDC007369 TaxID=3154589 RepID=UPI0033FABE54